MNISTLNEIKNDSVILYYKLPQAGYELWVGAEEKAKKIIELIRSAFPGDEGLRIYQGSLQTQEKTEDYLILVEKDNKIRMQGGSWETVFKISSLEEDVDVKAIIPLFELKNEEEEVTKMTQAEILTGADIITTAKPGVLYQTITEPVVLIKKDVNGAFIYNDTKEVTVIDNSFLAERFTLYVEEETERNYLKTKEAIKALADGKHIHADLYLPNGEIERDICLNSFLPISELIDELEESGPIELIKFMASFKKDFENKEQEALELFNPINARIPVELLLYGKFFIEKEEDNPLFSL